MNKTSPGSSEDNNPELRPAQDVMRLQRLGAFHQSRLSFVRSLVRLMARQRWDIRLHRCELNPQGYGARVYRVQTPDRIYDFVAFSTALEADQRSDRVIAQSWDASFALVDGEADDELVRYLAQNAPRQEQGRMKPPVLVMSRANRSVRLFEHVIDCLVKGVQPHISELTRSGYLMRTTAVYGNGKFGLGDYGRPGTDGEMKASFRAQMLAVYLVRMFSFDLINHIAEHRALAAQSGQPAARLAPSLCQFLGIGNATGLGMAPFLVSHPALISRWIEQREIAISATNAVTSISDEIRTAFKKLSERARAHFSEFTTDDTVQQARYDRLIGEIDLLLKQCDSLLNGNQPWRQLQSWAKDLSIEMQELINSLILEMHPEIVDPLAEQMDADEPDALDTTQTIEQLMQTIEDHYDWALAIDFNSAENQEVFWYRSEEKEEPRLGKRFEQPGAELEMKIGVARDVSQLYEHLTKQLRQTVATENSNAHLTAQSLVAEFILRQPQHRGLVRRIQSASARRYGEIRDNLVSADCRPIDLLRCKLSFFGASRFDPKSDLWTRITLFQGAPLAEQLGDVDADDWAFPISPQG